MSNVNILSILKTVSFIFFKCVGSERVKCHWVIRPGHEMSCPEIAKKQMNCITM